MSTFTQPVTAAVLGAWSRAIVSGVEHNALEAIALFVICCTHRIYRVARLLSRTPGALLKICVSIYKMDDTSQAR